LKARLYQIKAGFAMNRIAIWSVPIAAVFLTACGSAVQTEPPLAGAAIGGPYTLTDQNGRTVRDSDFKGKWQIVYFGYSFCPDVCPTDLQHIGQALRLLEKKDAPLAAKVTPIFITVDPERDTPAVLKQYVANFHPRMLGLTGGAGAIAKVAKEYAIYYQKGPIKDGTYAVNHSRQSYLMDPDGKPVALLPSEQSGEAVASEIEKWAK